MDAGHAEQRRAESRAVRKALGFGEDADDVSPQDLLNALARRDLLQRAEELEALAEHFLVGESHKRFIKQRAHRLRQQAKELAKCHSPKT
jgi:dihydropteroate synthase